MDKKIVHDARDCFEPYNLFDGKAALYKYRANYSNECIEYLCKKYRITSSSTIADIGGGTGILSKQFHDYSGCQIILVEPNMGMISEAKSQINDNYAKIICSTAEETQIPDSSIDLIVVGTAFHWFEMNKFREECIRIGKKPVQVALLRLYNFVPDINADNSSDYHSIDSEAHRAKFFFDNDNMTHKLFFHDEVFDEHRFVGERLSDHNAPNKLDEGYDKFVSDAKKAFAYFKAPIINNVFITSCMDGDIE